MPKTEHHLRIMIADHQAIIRSALRLLLEQEPGMSVVAEAADGEEVERLLPLARPDLLLIDWELPGNCVPIIIARSHPHARVIVLSGRSEVRQQALEAGADLFLSKGDAPDRVLAAVRRFCPAL